MHNFGLLVCSKWGNARKTWSFLVLTVGWYGVSGKVAILSTLSTEQFALLTRVTYYDSPDIVAFLARCEAWYLSRPLS
jgi:hypothetical protein